MNKFLIFCIAMLCTGATNAIQLQSQNEFGTGEGRNQNMTVACTNTLGQVTTDICRLRRFARCGGKGNCDGWNEWIDVRHPGTVYAEWRAAATACCSHLGHR